MNLFFLDKCFKKSAEYHVNSHCVKQILEATQILCATFHLQDIQAPYKLSHKNHPSTVFCRQSEENFMWVFDYASALSDEYTYRYGKIHKSTEVLKWVANNAHKLSFPQKGITEFAIAISQDSECRKIDGFDSMCPIQKYRSYYKLDKKHLHSWKSRDKPEWI